MQSWSDWNRRHDNWHNATWAERQIRDFLIDITLQNEAILAKLEKREHKLSPEDQAKLNQIFEKATATTAKLDQAQPKT